MILIDSSVLLDIVTKDPVWFDWSAFALASFVDTSELCINPLICAEASIRFASPQDFDAKFPETIFRRESLPYEAAFLAGKAFVEYRRRGGLKTSPLADFYIGAHAAVCGFGILTRDPRRFRRYFPTVEVIAP